MHFPEVNADWLIKGTGDPFTKEANKIFTKDIFETLCPECDFKLFNIVKMEKEINHLKTQIKELEKDNKELKSIIHIFN